MGRSEGIFLEALEVPCTADLGIFLEVFLEVELRYLRSKGAPKTTLGGPLGVRVGRLQRPWFTCMSDRDPVISSGIFLHQGMAGACKQETKSFYVPCRCRHTPFKALKVLWC